MTQWPLQPWIEWRGEGYATYCKGGTLHRLSAEDASPDRRVSRLTAPSPESPVLSGGQPRSLSDILGGPRWQQGQLERCYTVHSTRGLPQANLHHPPPATCTRRPAPAASSMHSPTTGHELHAGPLRQLLGDGALPLPLLVLALHAQDVAACRVASGPQGTHQRSALSTSSAHSWRQAA
jgi:hypothetical protein